LGCLLHQGVPIRETPQPVAQDPAKPIEPGAAEIRAELERILASRCFEQAARSSGFLRFVVEETLAGQGERLKGYTIAVEVFGRPADFDAQSDPLVRVEAGRLRRRLIEYYADEGRENPVRLELPRGSYAVVGSYHTVGVPSTAADVLLGPMPSESHAENETARNRRRWRRVRALLVTTVILAGLGVIVFQQFQASRVGLSAPAAAAGSRGKPPLVVLPFESLGQGTGLAELAATLTEELLLLFGGPEVLVVAMQGGTHETLTPPAYALSGSVRETNGVVRITARLVRIDTGTQLWGVAYDEPSTALRSPGGERLVARRIATVAEPYGPIFAAELERLRGVAAATLGTRDCVILYYDYRRLLGRAEHARALDCFERAANRDAGSVEAWAGLALLFAEAWAQGYTDERGAAAAPVLERAREAARHAMDIDGASMLANLALAAAQFFGGADPRNVAERVLSAWPESPVAQAYLGCMFILRGETERGRTLVDRAIESTLEVPSGYYASLSLAALREQRYGDALASALRIDSPDWALGHVIVAAAGALGGRADLAARARARAVALDPTLEASLSAVLDRWRVESVLAAELERGFAAAVP
jgi:adenylate cyclase